MTNKKIIGIVFLMMFLLSSFVYAGDLENSASEIDFLDDNNNIDVGDYYISDNVISVNSENYNFIKVKTKDVYETRCTKYDDIVNKNGTTESICTKYGDVKISEEYKLATLTFNNCNEDKYYRIYKYSEYSTDKKEIISKGSRYTDIKCIDNKLTFNIDSFSSYTAEEIASLQAGLLFYSSLDDDSLSGSTYTDLSDDEWDFDVYNGALTGQTGIAGQSVYVDGVNDYLASETSGGLRLDGNNNITIGAWYKTNAPKEVGIIFGTETEVGKSWGGSGIGAWNTDLITYRFGTGVNDVNSRQNVAFTYNDGDWHFLTQVWNDTGGTAYVTVFIDGVKVGVTGSTSNDIIDDGDIVKLGYATYGDYQIGYVDEVFIYTRSLSPDEINAIYDINTQGFNIFNYDTGGVEAINITNISQTPSDLTLFGFDAPTNIVYNITNFNTSFNPYLNFSVYDSTPCLVFTAGVCSYYNNSVVTKTATTNTTDIFNFSVLTPAYVPGNYNFNQSLMTSYTKNFYSVGSNKRAKINFNNLTNISENHLLDAYLDASSSGVNVNVYYCNSSYTDGNPASSLYCDIVGSFNNVSSYNYTSGNSSYDRAVINLQNLNIDFTSSGSFILLSDDNFNVGYITNTTGTSFISGNNGVTYSALGGTFDFHLHRVKDGVVFNYNACAIDLNGDTICSDTIYDTLGFEPFSIPPTLNIIYPNNGDTFQINQSINISWSGVDIQSNTTLSYDLIVDGVSLLSSSNLTIYELDLTGYNGSVNITLIVSNGILSNTESHIISIAPYEAPFIPSASGFNLDTCPSSGVQITNFLIGFAICMGLLFLSDRFNVKPFGFIGCVGIFYLSMVYINCNEVIGSVGIIASIFLFLVVAYN